MAQRAGQMTGAGKHLPAWVALAAIGAALAAGFLPVLWLGLADGPGAFDAYVLRVLQFTLLQAGLSTLLSLILGLALARALARQDFPGRTLVLRLLNLPLALPAIVVIIGIVGVYGSSGWLGGAVAIYGLQGILLAHVFFNAPLAARLLLGELERIPSESWKLAAQLQFRDIDVFRLVEWPQLRAALPGVALLIFLLCAASFAVVLTLGGGPRATTLEVAIYQSLRADFDPQRAAALAMVQLALCAALVLLAQRFGGLMPGLPVLGRRPPRFDGQAMIGRSADIAVIAMGLLLLLPPLASVVASGFANITASPALLYAAATSAAARSSTWSRTARLAVLAAWIIPPAVLATGWFIVLRGAASLTGLAAALVIGMNALMALPFAYQTLAPAMDAAARRHDRLCANLGIAGWNRFRQIDLPTLRRPALLGLMMAFIVALGDLTAIALFGSQDLVTLPALIYRQMGSYRFDEAAGTALVFALLVLALVSLAERWSAQHD
ncbi:MAG: ABC transporter permease subunit [Alphaproteobacteria bacterium]|nr:ABC transporter permease subunit [Alphaproteobacteria bacterium]